MTIYKFTHLHIYTFALCLVLLFTGCRPHGVLSSKQMRSVLYDLHRTDAILQAAGYNYGHDEDVAKYYQAVMDKHGGDAGAVR